MMCVASRIAGLAKRVRHVVLCMAINMPVISRLSNADLYRSIVLGASVMSARPVELSMCHWKKFNSNEGNCCLAPKELDST
jgi:hypothetical protein